MFTLIIVYLVVQIVVNVSMEKRLRAQEARIAQIESKLTAASSPLHGRA